MAFATRAGTPRRGRNRAWTGLLAAAATLALPASAAPAPPGPPAHPSYLAVGGDDDTMIFVDTRSMTKAAVWVAFAWREPQDGGAATALALEQIECAKSTTQETYRASYDVDGRVLATNAAPQASRPVDPDSQISAVVDFVCRGTKALKADFRFRTLRDARAWLVTPRTGLQLP